MRFKLIIIFILFLFVSCDDKEISCIDSENFNHIYNYIQKEEKNITIIRNENFYLYKIDKSKNRIKIDDNEYMDFFNKYPFIGCIKNRTILLNYCDNLEVIKNNNGAKSGIYITAYGTNKILERFNTKKMEITLIEFQECENILFLGWGLIGRGFVISEKLELNSLDYDELYALGYGSAKKFNYEHLYYYGVY